MLTYRMKKIITRFCRLGVCGISVLAAILLFVRYLDVLLEGKRDMSTSQETSIGSLTQMRADKVKLFRKKLSVVKSKVLGYTSQIRCNAESRHTPCIAEPPLSAKELFENVIDFNIERTFTFSGSHTSEIDSTIPRIIHFMWTNATLPTVFVDNVKSFLLHHPGWTFYFWTYAHGRVFIKDHYPELLPAFDGYRADVTRSDMLRLAIMHHYGGAYFDLDTKCLRPLDAIVNKETCVFSPEPVEHAVFTLHIPSILNGCVLMCRHGHKFYEFALAQLPFTKNNSVISSAGPVFLTRMVNYFLASQHTLQLSENDKFHIVSNELFLSRIKPNVKRKLRTNCSATLQTPLEKMACDHWKRRHRMPKMTAFTDHQYFGTYNKMHLLRFEPQNHFRNIIHEVKEYTSEAQDLNNLGRFEMLVLCLLFVIITRIKK